MENTRERTKRAVLLVYVLAFYSVWTLWEFWGKGVVNSAIPDPFLSQLVKSGVIKNLVWTLPAILLVRRFGSDMHITLKEMFTAKVNWLKFLPVFVAFTVYICGGSILRNGRLAVSDGFELHQLITVLFVGLTEELVFRGWLLNATVKEGKKWPYVLLNAVMFLAIHFPKWLCSGTFVSSFASLAFLEVMALSVVFSWSFLKSRSILVPIALHMYWDLLVFLLI